MKLCAIILSLSSLIGGVETVLEARFKELPKAELSFSKPLSQEIPDPSPRDSLGAIQEALADAQNRDVSITELLQTHEEE
jgi:hypothetical protein